MTDARVKSGIPELDGMLKGGFMQGDAVMVAGSAGTGKTTLALQYLVNGVTRFGDNALYVTFEQLPDQIYRDAMNFGWDLRKMEQENRFRTICTSPKLLVEDAADAGNILDDPIKEVQPRRIVIDSLSHLEMFVGSRDVRRETYRLIMYLKTKGLSSLLVYETPQVIGQALSITEVGLSFLVDCIVLLRLVEIESSMRKAMVVLKMRGSDHDKGLREFHITPYGVSVAKPFSDYEGIITGAPRRVGAERFAEIFSKAAKKKG